MIGRNDPCWCGSQKKWKQCHYPSLQAGVGVSPSQIKEEYLRKYHILIKDKEQIDKIRASCHLASRILMETAAMAKPGVTTLALDAFAHKRCLEAGAIPAALGYGTPPFPKGICTSINEVICHGIPDKTVLKEGDILNIDITTILDGYFGDCSCMVVIGGKTTPERQLVVDVAYECLIRAIAILKPGVLVKEIGEAIESYATVKGCSVVHQFVSHGVGIEFHEGPQIAHCRNRCPIRLVPGMTFTIEPMINAGVADAVIDPLDQWTARTKDGRASAQWEHTVLITEEGHEVLTNWVR